MSPPSKPQPDDRGRAEVPRADKLTAGWREWLSLPDLGIPAIKAKVDTGARTSALHTAHSELFQRNGKKYVRFWIHPLQRRSDIVLTSTALLLDQRIVSDSGGHREKRYVIETTMRLAENEWPIEITLTNRDSMLFRMLLGRTAMKDRVIVEPNASYVMGKRPNLAKLYAEYN